MSDKRSAPSGLDRAGLVSVDDTIDDIAAQALRAAQEAEERAKLKKEARGGKVKNIPSSPQTSPTREKKPSK